MLQEKLEIFCEMNVKIHVSGINHASSGIKGNQ